MALESQWRRACRLNTIETGQSPIDRALEILLILDTVVVQTCTPNSIPVAFSGCAFAADYHEEL